MKFFFFLTALFSSAIVNAQFWTEKATGFTTASRTLNSLSLVDANVIWASAVDGSTPSDLDYTIKEFTRSTDGGATWTPGTINLGAGTSGLGISSITAVSSTTAWVSAYPDSGNALGGIWKTTDSGATWTKQTSALYNNPDDSYTNFVHFWDANNGIACGDPESNVFEIYTTTNGGTTWTRVPETNLPDPDVNGEFGYFNLYTVSGNTIWFGTDKGRIYKSTDKGLTWTVSQSPSQDFGLDKFTFSDENKGLLMTYSPTKLYSTTDGGTTWVPVITTGYFYNTDITYVSGTSKVVSGNSAAPLGSSYSLDDGVTWIKIDNVYHGAMVFLNDSFGFSASMNTSSTVGGIFKYSGGELSTLSLSANPTLCTIVGSTATISVESNIISPVYQWQYRKVTTAVPNPAWITITSTNAGAVYSNYTTATLGITRATTALPAVGTQYKVVINGSIASDIANLTIMGPTKAGTITAVPTTLKACTGGVVGFALGGYVGTSIQWQTASTLGSTTSDPIIPSDWSDIEGATSAAYTTGELTTVSNRYYRAVVSNTCTGVSATTSVKMITVNPASDGGTVGVGTNLDDDLQVCENSTTKNTLKVTGYVGTIQWEYSTDNGANWSAVPSGSSSSPLVGSAFTTTSTGKATTYIVYGFTQNTLFRVTATSGVCLSAPSANYVTCTLTSATATSVSAIGTVCSGTSTTLSLDSNYTGVIKWLKSTNDWTTFSTVAGTNPTVSTGNLTVATAFKAVLTVGGTCTSETEPIIVDVYAKPLAKSITSPTASGKATAPLCTDVTKVLNITPGYSTDTIQWEKAVVDLASTTAPLTSDYTPISGAIYESYNVADVSTGKNYFRAKFTIGGCDSKAVYSSSFIVYYKDCGAAKMINKTAAAKSFEVVVSPNPYTENFKLSLNTSSEENVGIMVYDMLGKLIEQKEVKPSEVSELQLGNNYSTGIYNIISNQGTEVKTLRVIKR